MNRPVLVEACVDSVASAIAAERGGAGRLELCDALHDGGTTPSAGMIAAVKARVAIPVFVIVRPRGGGFVYSADELDVMLRDIDAARRAGADGIVVGALTTTAEIDDRHMKTLIDAADRLPVTVHRAIDWTRDIAAALESVISLGAARVLTSGAAATALAGAETIASLVARAAGRIAILAGGGIREENVAEVVARSGVREVHVRGTRAARSGMTPPPAGIGFRKALPDDEEAWEETDESRIRSLAALANR